MKKYKKKIAIFFGGKSAEHEVSIESAKNILRAINKEKYNVVLIGISQKGDWFRVSEKKFLSQDYIKVENPKGGRAIPFSKGGSFFLKTKDKDMKIDVAFPILHGPFGEDGAIQGLFKIFNVPFIGAGILGSAVGMDKDICKKLLRNSGIPTANFLTFNNSQKNKIFFDDIKEVLKTPFFIKPANLGSSVGISKVEKETDFEKAKELAFKFDNKIILEEYIEGREMECSVLGNENPKASIVGEIISNHEFYSYKAKYLDKKGAKISIPANISDKMMKKIRNLAIKTYKTLCCEGMGRVDFFLTKKNKIFVNEINTIPGFTSVSMHPKLWEASGVSYSKLIDELINLAIKRHKSEKGLKNTYKD